MIPTEDVDVVARQTAWSAEYLDVQRVQTQFRMQLVEGWQIPQGAKVLEIGCGQGDMTAALAHAVGPTGHVTAVDIASPEYGAPVTLGQAAAHLKNAPLGERIDFRFEFDVLDPATAFPADSFDYVVLTHCSWYFESLNRLRQVFQHLRPWAGRLCYSEWDIEPQSMDQVAHMLAVLIQGQVEAYKVGSISNVRTPFSRTRLKQILQETGWNVTMETDIDSRELQDAGWEIDSCLRSSLPDAFALHLPVKHLELLSSQVDILRQMAGRGNNRSLPSYSIVAERASEPLP
ncbi:MAG: Methyltransferase type 11 [Chthonomonadaceae bacterium]|nr:Methyltransferase type 11 [Chthonomonadaceae bacterium]